jgi:hypothetical protein
MTRRSRIWRVVATVFSVANLAFAAYAAALGEGIHTAVHFVLMLLGAYVAWRLTPRAPRREEVTLPPAHDARLDYLQQSVDAIALEVERIGEAQRYSAKVQAQRAGGSPPKT